MRSQTCLIKLLVLVACVIAWSSAAGQVVDLNVAMMQATVKLEGRGSIGTGFILVRPLPKQTGAPGTITGKVVLVTAAHVFQEMQRDEAVVHLRERQTQPPDTWIRRPYVLPIRRNGQPLWRRHSEADVAVMYIGLPVPLFDNAIPTDMLATDDMLQKYQMGPGTEIRCIGYPLGMESNLAGFPILRTGVIASYPLLPTAHTKTFLFDFRVFQGNSGGPVYFCQPPFRGGVSFGPGAQFILGLVSQEKLFTSVTTELYESTTKQTPLSIGVVVHASIIMQTIELLPSPDSPESEAVVVPLRPSHPQ